MVLKVDTRSHLQELVREHSELDMNEDPEVDHIHDPKLRKLQARGWLDSRIKQLTQIERLAIMELEKAHEAGYLRWNEIYPAKREYHEAFETLRTTARQKYKQAIRAQSESLVAPPSR